jgi:hypothetical protein
LVKSRHGGLKFIQEGKDEKVLFFLDVQADTIKWIVEGVGYKPHIPSLKALSYPVSCS